MVANDMGAMANPAAPTRAVLAKKSRRLKTRRRWLWHPVACVWLSISSPLNSLGWPGRSSDSVNSFATRQSRPLQLCPSRAHRRSVRFGRWQTDRAGCRFQL